LPTEDVEAYLELGERLRTQLHPIGELESMLVDRIVGINWRLRRLGRIETGVLTYHHFAIRAERARKNAESQTRVVLTPGEASLTKMLNPPREILDTAKHQEFVAEQYENELAKESDIATCGEAFIRDTLQGNALSKLSRYEAGFERSLFKTLSELQRLQGIPRRKKEPVREVVDLSADTE
jgi:hypothetical protein